MTYNLGALADIIAHPEDDTPRLIYADWLDDHDQSERAEFIRIQCSIAIDEHALVSGSMPPVLTLEFWPAGMEQRLVVHQKNVRKQLEQDRRRERELLEKNRQDWTNLIPGFVTDAWSLDEPMQSYVYGARVKYRRGFVSEIICTLEDWCGVECERCEGRGQERLGFAEGMHLGHLWDQCHVCHGTGRIGGHGPALVRAAPLERVTLSDQEPSEALSAAYLAWARSPLQGSPNGLLGKIPD